MKRGFCLLYLYIAGFAEILQTCRFAAGNIPLNTDLKTNQNTVHRDDVTVTLVQHVPFKVKYTYMSCDSPLLSYPPHSASASLGRKTT